jgi:tetratricopeptide (TPR) repeat protein
MQDISTLDQLRKGDMLADVKYILYWTEGLSAYQKYNYDRAITYFEKALAIDKEGTCDASNHTLLANLYHELGRDSIALIHCEKALKSQRLAGDSTSPFYAYLMICYGAVKNSLVKKDKEAFQSIRSGIAMLENFPRKDSMNMGIGYTELGKYYEEGYDPDSALMEYSKALSYLNKKDPSHISAIMVLHNNIGIVHINKRNFREGITELHIALQFQNRLGRPDLNMSSYILAGLGSAYAQIGGRNDSAEIFYHQADSILSTFMSNATRRASLMTNNGNLFLGLGNYPLARQYHQKAVELLKNTPDTLTGLYADALINLGESLKKTGDPGNATKLELEAETIYIKIRRKDPSSLAVLYIDLADDFCEQDTVAAGKYLTKTLQLLSQAPADPLWSYYYWIKARLAIKKGDLPGARRETESAFNIFSKSGDWNTDTNVDCIEFKKFRNDLLNRRG